MVDVAKAMTDLNAVTREIGIPKTVAMMIAQSRDDTFERRRRTAVFVSTLMGHECEGGEQSYGYIATCECCGQVVKVPRAEPGIIGRAVEFECPSAETGR